LDASESRSEIHEEDLVDCSCETHRGVTQSKEEKNIPHTMKRKKTNWIGHMLRGNCLLKHVTSVKTTRKTEVMNDEEEDVSRYWMTLSK